mgnify:CR=1 FL=1
MGPLAARRLARKHDGDDCGVEDAKRKEESARPRRNRATATDSARRRGPRTTAEPARRQRTRRCDEVSTRRRIGAAAANVATGRRGCCEGPVDGSRKVVCVRCRSVRGTWSGAGAGRSRRGLRRDVTVRAWSATTSVSPSWGSRRAVRVGRGAGSPPRGSRVVRAIGAFVAGRASRPRRRQFTAGARRCWFAFGSGGRDAGDSPRRFGQRRFGCGSGGRGAGSSPRASRVGGPSVGGRRCVRRCRPLRRWSRGRRHGRRKRIVRITS